MNNSPKIYTCQNLEKIVERLQDDLQNNDNGGKNFVLIYAHNGTGKTRLSMTFKDSRKNKGNRDTLYFNAYTEDLFSWDNDLINDTNPRLKINSDSKFFAGFKELALEKDIFLYLERYVKFNFKIDYENWMIEFYRDEGNIKISRGEENIFIWCIFLAIIKLCVDADETYNWVKYIYIDDPISSLDDNNAIAVACDLATLLKSGQNSFKTIINSHHSLFFNVMFNELKKSKSIQYFLSFDTNENRYNLQKTNDTPFFHHVALLSELQNAVALDKIDTYHFNILRSILEKTAAFFGYEKISQCVHGIEDKVLFNRALHLLSHGQYSIFNPTKMGEDTKNLFKNILKGFLDKYEFELPELIKKSKNNQNKQ